MPTYIRFGDEHYVAVNEGWDEVRRRIDAAASAPLPLFEATRIDGARMLLNAAEVRTITEGASKDERQ
jgi:hypothetical protein